MGLIRLIVLAALAALLIAAPPVRAAAPAPLPEAQSQQLTSFLTAVNQEAHGYLPPLTFQSVVQGIFHAGQSGWNPGTVLSGLTRYLVHTLLQSSVLLGKLVILGVACAMLENVSRAFGSEQVARIAYTVAYLALLALALESFTGALGIGRGTVSDLVHLMEAMLPLLVTLIASVGAFTSAGLFNPLVVFAITMVPLVVGSVVLPLVYLSTLVEMVGTFTLYKLKPFAGLLRQSALVSLALFMTVFLGFVAVFGAAGPVSDGVTLKTAKFVAATFIPVVGKLFADSAEIVFGSSFLLKQAVSVIGLIGLFLTLIFPVLKLVSIMMAYRVSAAVLGPVGGEPLVDSLSAMGNAVMYIAIAVGCVGLMLFLVFTITLAAGRGVLP